MGKTNEQKAIELLRSLGWKAGRCDRREGPVTKDLFGFADVAAVHPERQGTLYVQATTTGDAYRRVRKILDLLPAASAVLRAGNTIEVWGFNGDKPLTNCTYFEVDICKGRGKAPTMATLTAIKGSRILELDNG